MAAFRGALAKRAQWLTCFQLASSPNRSLRFPPHMTGDTTAQTTALVATLRKFTSLAQREADFPDVIKQWHPTKNQSTPDSVAAYSHKKFWFLCDRGHEWESSVANRTGNKRGCPVCNLTRVSSSHNLLVKHPEVAAEWHPTKNGTLRPEAVAPYSHTKAWWQCKADPTHEWHSAVYSRTLNKAGCQKCYLQRQRGTHRSTVSLLAARPDLAQEWHPTKNEILTPDMMSHCSRKKVWWLCSSDSTHEWQTNVYSRSVGHSG
eukprot:Colp12_sorted_trinity150504_noHs@25587